MHVKDVVWLRFPPKVDGQHSFDDKVELPKASETVLTLHKHAPFDAWAKHGRFH